MRANILITASNRVIGGRRMLSLDEAYIHALTLAGANVFVAAQGDPSELACRMDGIVFSGGVDLHPACYGEEIRGKGIELDVQRDIFEFALFRAFYRKKKPIFGICRGIQLINVALGGSLWQDIESEYEDGLSHASGSLPHRIKTQSCSRIAAAVGEEAAVNTYHHQAIRKIGKGLVVTAKCEDGMVEAVEHKTHPVWGVQWHPERMDGMGRLFFDFIESARVRARWGGE